MNQQYNPARNLCAYVFALLTIVVLDCGTVDAQQRPLLKKNLITRFPFKVLEDGIIVFKATLNNLPDSLTFIFDTGNGGISLDSTTVSALKLPVKPSDKILRGVGVMKKLSYVYDQTLHIPHLAAEHLDFHINDYDLLTSANGIKIDGIIGYSLISRYIVYIDYDNNFLEFYKPGEVRYPKRGHFIHPEITGIPVFDALLEDSTIHRSNFFFDTGAGLCLLMSEKYEADSSILKKRKKVIITQAEGIGKKRMKLSTVKKITIGPYKFRKVPAYVFDDDVNVTNYPKTGGLIGNDLLRRFNLILDYGNKIIQLIPNTRFKDPFDYSYTGLSLYLHDGQVVIEDVIENSPGAKAGVMPGDVIVAVDKNFSGDLQAYKGILEVVDAKPTIVVNRHGELFTCKFKVQSILK